MEVNFDLLVSGCNTECRHCYVKGGPGKLMPLQDALLCIEKLDEIAAALPFPASFTLDNEPMNHPQIAGILRAAASVRHIEHFHHGMTTGIALMRREDREAVVKAYLDRGCDEFGITLHGSPEHHDEIVCRKGACQASLEAAAFLRSCGARVNVSLMFNRFFPEDAALIDQTLERLEPSFIYFAIPNYTPHSRMSGFEPYRGTREDLNALSPWIDKWGRSRAVLKRSAETFTPGEAAQRLEQGPDYRELFREEQHSLFLSVHPDRLLYLGNTGVETALLGDLRSLDAAQTAQQIGRFPGNMDYGAFYDPERLPDQEELLRALKRLPQDLLYADLASVLYRGLEELGVPTILLPPRGETADPIQTTKQA